MYCLNIDIVYFWWITNFELQATWSSVLIVSLSCENNYGIKWKYRWFKFSELWDQD